MKLRTVITHPLLVPVLTQLLVGYVWLSAGLEKLAGGNFPSGLAEMLDAFSAKNPHTWYVTSVLTFAKLHAPVFGQFVQWGELLTGIGLLACALLYVFGRTRTLQATGYNLSIAAFAAGALMSANFYLAAGWMSPSTSGLNMLMFWIQLALLSHLVSKPTSR
jgi:hypothetical protein